MRGSLRWIDNASLLSTGHMRLSRAIGYLLMGRQQWQHIGTSKDRAIRATIAASGSQEVSFIFVARKACECRYQFFS